MDEKEAAVIVGVFAGIVVDDVVLSLTPGCLSRAQDSLPLGCVLKIFFPPTRRGKGAAEEPADVTDGR